MGSTEECRTGPAEQQCGNEKAKRNAIVQTQRRTTNYLGSKNLQCVLKKRRARRNITRMRDRDDDDNNEGDDARYAAARGGG